MIDEHPLSLLRRSGAMLRALRDTRCLRGAIWDAITDLMSDIERFDLEQHDQRRSGVALEQRAGQAGIDLDTPR
jgi:hypothetical protein